MGMEPLSLNDALATPMYDAFAGTIVNPDPIDAIVPGRRPRGDEPAGCAIGSQRSHVSLNLAATDEGVHRSPSTAILWHSVYGADSVPPPPGPNAESAGGGDADGDEGGDADD